ncbi:MAG: phosphoadenosine phosphosulfate reductase [Clostridia bacterium]|jgi:phosphoadenosine phosphosulfate reductase|nr:phosphoadenosine phosphosulfate reductase [Clostridia bacterium]
MKVFWCSKCQVPVINETKCKCGNETRYMTTDIRPVFPEEKHLMYKITKDKLFIEGPVWAAKGFKYFVGERFEAVSLNSLVPIINEKEIVNYLNNLDLNDEYLEFNKNIQKFVEVNSKHLHVIEFAAMDFIKNAVKQYPSNLPVVSFSGGKDSTVVSHLVRRALSNPSILHLFGDTTLEFPFTYKYIERFRRDNPRTPFFTSRSNHNFMDLCQKMGPPSRVMSWCCTVFKTGPLNNTINNFAKGKNLLTFYGIRGSESVTRRDYQKVEFNNFDFIKNSEITSSPKIAKQKVTSPIFDWYDVEVWLYILSHNVDFNDGYRLGFSRVGCWCCPNNSKWSMVLASIYMPEQYKQWNDFLINFAKRIGKKDAELYVATGKWKARQGGAGLDNRQIHVEAKPCIDEEFSRTFTLTKPINDELYEYFKPFGKVSKELGRKLLNEVVIIDKKTNKQILKLQGKAGTYNLKVVAINPSNYRLLSQRIDCQLRKFQSCIGCLGCVSICPNGAISYVDGTYRIIENKCLGEKCLACINPWRGGCLMSKVLAVKRGV